MLRSSSNLGFPRRIVVYYLLFCLIAVSCLGVGILLTAHGVMDTRTTGACLARLGKTAAALELDYLRFGTENTQQILRSSQWADSLQSYAVVSLEGTIIAHSDVSLVGQTAAEPHGEQLRWGAVTGVRYQDEQGKILNEYRVPLVAHDEHFGTLRITVRQLSVWSTLAEIARVAPAVLLLPLGLVAVGGLYLGRLAKPMARVDSQLRRIALERPTVDIELKPLPAKDAISIGWNRIVKRLQDAGASNNASDLDTRLSEVVAARSQGQLQSVLHNLNEGIAVTDVEGRITFANRAVAALLGTETTTEELAGIELEGRIVEATGRGADERLFDAAANHRPSTMEVERDSDGECRTLRVARLPMESEDIHGHVWSVRDITQQKLTERTRDQFIDAATHELRTPLSNIKAYAETLVMSDGIEVEQQKEFCNTINSEVTRLARFVDDLLSISSMEAGSIVIERKRTISARLFEEVLAKVQPLMKHKEIDFHVQLPEKMADMELDKDKIVAVLVNLLGNAAKYTPAKGRVALRVKVDDAQLQIAVEDTGVGIAPEEIPKVFDKFFRSSDPRVQEEAGTGLGLSLAREVIRMHGGDITVESKVDQGSTFLATIPIH